MIQNILSRLQRTLSGTGTAFRSGMLAFPLSWAWSLAMTAVLLVMIHNDILLRKDDLLGALLAATSAGILLSLAAGLAVRMGVSRGWAAALWVGATLVPIGHGFLTYSTLVEVWSPELEWHRQVAFYTVAVLLVAVARLRGIGWEDHLRHVFQILSALLHAGGMAILLAAGISATLVSIHALFDVTVPQRLYSDVWLLAGFCLGWTYFLGVFSEQLRDGVRFVLPTPEYLQRMVAWVLRPLLVVYLMVITVYAGKILLFWELPRGVISGMVLGYGTTLLAMFLLANLAFPEEARKRWTLFFAFSFPIPSTLMAVAVVRRLLDHGFTEARLLLVLGGLLVSLGVWLHARKGVLVWPVLTLGLLTAAVGFLPGPYGWSAVTRTSQQERLQSIFSRYGLGVGMPFPATARMKLSDRLAVSSKLEYLIDVHGPASLQRWFPALQDNDSTRYGLADSLVRQLGLVPLDNWTYRILPDSLQDSMVTNSEALTVSVVSNNVQATAPSQPMQVAAGSICQAIYNNEYGHNVQDTSTLDSNALRFRTGPFGGLVVPLDTIVGWASSGGSNYASLTTPFTYHGSQGARRWEFQVTHASYRLGATGKPIFNSLSGLICASPAK